MKRFSENMDEVLSELNAKYELQSGARCQFADKWSAADSEALQ
jgi:hypothetical protein